MQDFLCSGSGHPCKGEQKLPEKSSAGSILEQCGQEANDEQQSVCREMMACEDTETEELALSVFMVTHLLQNKHLVMIPLKCGKNARLFPLTSD